MSAHAACSPCVIGCVGGCDRPSLYVNSAAWLRPGQIRPVPTDAAHADVFKKVRRSSLIRGLPRKLVFGTVSVGMPGAPASCTLFIYGHGPAYLNFNA